MAVVHVSTWEDFKTAVAGTDNQVIIDNDIICNEILSDDMTWNCESIDGQEHAIYNIQSTYNGTEFKAGRIITVSNLGFLNFTLYGTSQDHGMFKQTDYGRNRFVFNDCQFQGMSLKGLFDDGCECTRCSITLTSCRFLISDSFQHEAFFHECWIDLGTVTCKRGDNFIMFASLRNTYVKGTINLTDETDRFDIIRGYIVNSIFNCYVKCTANRTINLRYNNESIENVCLYNSDRIQVATESNFYHSGWTGLTDGNLKSATAVQATGFPIIV